MKGLQRVVRRALLSKLKTDAVLLAFVAKDSIDPPSNPIWPFVILESPVTQRLRMTCVDGGTVALDVHAFAGSRYENGALVEDARDHAGRIGEAIEHAFEDQWLGLPNGAEMRIRLSDIRLLPDDEPESYHWSAQVNCRVLAPA